MKAVLVTKYGPPEVLKYDDVEDPQPTAGQVRVRVRAVGVNFADILARVGLYPDAPKPPFIPGLEVSGEVEELGGDIQGLNVGQSVMALTMSAAYAEKVCVPAVQVVPLPPGMDFEVGAALPVNYLTAYHMLFTLGNIRPGERLLIHAAAGGVGLAAIELARIAGAEVFGTASRSKFEFLKERGVQHCIDYHTQDFEEIVRALTGGEGVDIVLDAVGGDSFAKSYRLLRPAGRLMVFGFSMAVTGASRNLLKAAGSYLRMPKFDPLRMMRENRAVMGVHLGHLRPEMIRSEYEQLLKYFAEGRIRPYVGKTFPLAQSSAAHRFIQERKNIGKVLLVA
jgi:NADPH:quinone reductase-like Zn-dependent oxidoreductase